MGILDFGFWGVWILDFGAGIPNPKSKSPKSKILNPKSPKSGQKSLDFGFWGFWILDFGDFGFWIFGILGILDFGLWGFWILAFGILEIFGFWGFWILDFGDFGFWIFGTLCSRCLCAKCGFWNLGIWDFGFRILGILDFGFWGSWILDFGLGILDGHLVTKFWMLHKKRRLCTPSRVGGFFGESLAKVVRYDWNIPGFLKMKFM